MKWLLCLAWAQIASAQQPALRGTVIGAETGEPLALSIITLTPTNRKQLTDSAGAFVFSAIAAGTYLVSVRQIAYAPLDTQIVVRDTGPTIHLSLRHLAIELPPVTITSRPPCANPGAPDPRVAPALAAVFDQLQQHARRFRLLADSFPFEYRLEQTLREVTSRGDTLRPTVRTIRLDSRSDRPYQVGRVVTPGWGPWGGSDVLVVHTPSLEDFSNTGFVEHHCFYLAGRDTIEGETLVRLDFEPATKIAWADMSGSAYLDSLTYQLRFTESSLTRPERSELANVATMVTRTRFRQAGPGIPVQDVLRAVTTFRLGGRRRRIETQRTIEVRFRNN